MIAIEELQERLVGLELPAGTVTFEEYEAWITAHALGSPPLPDGALHPTFVFYAGLRGAGYPIGHLFELVACPPEDGPMIGEMDLRQHRSPRVGEELHVTSRIVSIDRKHGRSGTFDVMHVRIDVRSSTGEPVGSLDNVFVYPRRDAS
jgi:hypothetical protein